MFDPLSPRPLYLQLADYLRRQIEGGALKPGERLMPELEIAEKYGLARGTVRQALALLVNQGLLQRTRGKGTFVTDTIVSSHSPLIGIVIPYLRDSLTVDIMRGAESVLRLNGYSLIFGPSDVSLDVECEQIKRLQRDKISGLILFPVSMPGEAPMLAQILRPSLPVVLIDRKIPEFAASSVFVDNRGGAYHAVEHLIALGHRRVACVTHDGYISSVEDRIRGYEQAMRAAGLVPFAAVSIVRREPTLEGQPPTYSDEDMEPVDQLLRSQDRPTALFCINDFIALGVMRHVLHRGLRVPQDIAIVGFDDIPLAPFMPVPLTTVAQPKFEIGAQAAMLLLDKISGKEPTARTVVLPTALVVRSSTSQS
jgi:GntR family transcriptional regulator of arabinose operon